MLIKIFTKKNEVEDTPTIADEIKARLDKLASDHTLGMITDKEYEELCRTINDGALKIAEEKINNLEDRI